MDWACSYARNVAHDRTYLLNRVDDSLKPKYLRGNAMGAILISTRPPETQGSLPPPPSLRLFYTIMSLSRLLRLFLALRPGLQSLHVVAQTGNGGL